MLKKAKKSRNSHNGHAIQVPNDESSINLQDCPKDKLVTAFEHVQLTCLSKASNYRRLKYDRASSPGYIDPFTNDGHEYSSKMSKDSSVYECPGRPLCPSMLFYSKNYQRRKSRLFIRNSRGLWSWIVLLILNFLHIFQPVACQENDLRCFLLQEGSVQNFFVDESLQVGRKIGTLNIGGDPSEDGDIYLRLEHPDTPVQISPNSKDIILTEKLDKEGDNGQSHYINVICQKKRSNEVDTVIPIIIRVTDSNDNAPIFIKAPYFINVSEATVVNTVILGEIEAIDRDQNGPFSTVQYSIAPGKHSDKFAFESPISPTLQLRKPLDYEADNLFNITIVAEDRGIPPQRTATYITIQVIDSDDQNPAFTRHRYMAFLPQPAVKNALLEVQPAPIFAEDQDEGIRANIIYSLGKDVEEAEYFHIDPNSGRVSMARSIPNDAIQQPVALSVVATQEDNSDRVASAILTVSRRGSSSTQLQFLQRSYSTMVPENISKGSLIVQTLINKNSLEYIRFSLERGGMEVFEVDPTGQIILGHHLDYERQKFYEFHVTVSDGEYNDTAVVQVNILNVNDWDPRFQYPQYEFFVSSLRIEPGDIVGNVTAADGDNDHITFSVRGQDANMFDINSSGEILVRRNLELNSTEAHIVLVAKDTGSPPRQSSVPVTIHFPQGLVKSLSMDTSSNFLLMVVFGSLVAIFVLVIVCLAIYIHKNKKYRDDKNAALPTKMSQIMSNGAPCTKTDPLTIVTQEDTKHSNSHLRRGYQNGSFRASTISVQSQDSGTLGGRPSSLKGSRRFLRNPLANGVALGGLAIPAHDTTDSVSLNGSNATTASTATVGSDTPPHHGSRSSSPNPVSKLFNPKRTAVVTPSAGSLSSFSTFDGTARATGGMPSSTKKQAPAPPIPPAPPMPPTMGDSNLPSGRLGVSTLRRTNPGDLTPIQVGRIVWPAAAYPKKVKKLSWEDELSNQTELNPEVSVTPMPPSSINQDAPNLTVYF